MNRNEGEVATLQTIIHSTAIGSFDSKSTAKWKPRFDQWYFGVLIK